MPQNVFQNIRHHFLFLIQPVVRPLTECYAHRFLCHNSGRLWFNLKTVSTVQESILFRIQRLLNLFWKNECSVVYTLHHLECVLKRITVSAGDVSRSIMILWTITPDLVLWLEGICRSCYNEGMPSRC